MKKEKITITASLAAEKKQDMPNILLLKKDSAKERKVQTSNENKTNTFILKKKFMIVDNIKDNIFSLNQNNNKVLEVIKISKSIAKKPILKNISLKLEPGKIVGLLGPNGSGKTTLFNLIIGKIFPDEGRITQKVVGLAYAAWDNKDTSVKSTIDFGKYNEDKIVSGIKGMGALLNTGQGSWAIQVDAIKYGDVEITDLYEDPIRAEIDTTTHTIQLPGAIFDKYVLEVMKSKIDGFSFTQKTVNGHTVL